MTLGLEPRAAVGAVSEPPRAPLDAGGVVQGEARVWNALRETDDDAHTVKAKLESSTLRVGRARSSVVMGTLVVRDI